MLLLSEKLLLYNAQSGEAGLSLREQASKFGSRDDGNAAVMGSLEILIAGDKVVGRRFCGEQIKKWAIALVADRSTRRNRDHQIGVQLEVREKRLNPKTGMAEVSADSRALEHVF
jgi:hypothetical protein